ncbi:SCO family protein [Undibacterium sp. Di26W]|uniref:SCO family protein n=1 Tax=Undibacterium sp. Di26W TaxID=3413035 RepID=UPI003BF41A37
MKAAFFALFFLLFSSSIDMANAAEDATLKGGAFDPPRIAPDFSLRGSDGTELKLSRYRGKLVVLEFGYTSCFDVCPTSLAMLAQVRKKLGALAADVQIVYVTVDPERDTAAILKPYLAAFDPSFVGATGSPEQLARVRKDYGISASKNMVPGSKTAYTMSHSSYLYLIDRQGSLRSMMPFGSSVDDVAHDVRVLLSTQKK